MIPHPHLHLFKNAFFVSWVYGSMSAFTQFNYAEACLDSAPRLSEFVHGAS